MRVPGFLLQPIVENAIRHGIAPRLAGGTVEVSATRTGSILTLRVRDNGIGLPAGWQLSREGGVGLKNVAARLEHLYGGAASLRIEPAQGGGVDVSIDLPRYPP
jgi:sensor histidine kinase YesM